MWCCLCTVLLAGCGKKATSGETAATDMEEIPIVFENEEVKLCRYEGNTITGYSAEGYEPTEEEVEQRYAEVCLYAMEASGDYFEETDEWVAAHFDGINTVEELKAASKESLITEARMDAPYDNRKAAVEYVVSHSEVTPSEETRKNAEEQLLAMHRQDGINQGYDDFDAYLQKVGYANEAEFVASEYFQTEVSDALQLSLVAQAVAESAGLTVTDEQIQDYIESITEKGGTTTVDKESIRNYLLEQSAYDLIYNGTIFVTEDGKEIDAL